MSTKKQSFEEGMAALEALIEEIESGNLGLEETVAAYEKGMKLAKGLEKQLELSRGRLEKLLKDGQREEIEDVDA